ncbi:VIT family protein [Variovorax sp. HW608]|uniref:VIT1/CCC1 transporter family protein n=1 Tax=Variovorax sp. HW608 TaxID=1034889 RepID=UPI00081FD512|nr:VIT1/CCC1 transporter family protein [Variovorax sp. HW608]SCK50351.1 VIT family protein [Variovorax sp. HW608]
MENRVLDPIDRNSEILFGLFMVLSFTGTLSVATAGQKEVREMLVAAIGCNIAWGFVDGVMYVLRNLVVRARQARLWREVIAGGAPEPAHGLIAQELGPLASALGPSELERTRQWMVAQPAHVAPVAALTRQDLVGGLGVFLLVFASTFPPVLPFFFFSEVRPAMRVSAAIGIAIMFLCGYEWGRYAGLKPWRAAFVMAALGAGIQAVIIALGG